MDFNRQRKIFKAAIGGLVETYPHDLQLFNIPPTYEITLCEFEDLALERLKVLRIIEQTNLRGHSKSSDEWRKSVAEELKKQELKGYYRLVTGTGCGQTETDFQLRRRDHISHFILRLAYCRSEDLRRWFLTRELELFRLRWTYLTTEGKSSFLKINNLDYEPISEVERTEVMDISGGMIQFGTDYYKIPFQEVLDLVRSRRVFLYHGFAYITSTEIISVLSSLYRSNLALALVRTFQQLPMLQEDERLFKMLGNLHNTYTGEDYSNARDNKAVSIQSLDTLSRKSYPLCMRQLHENLRANHHLRHNGRQQYGLFLKGIGVTLEDALRFWRDEFTKKMDVDKFEKSYSYNVRHNYGKEGKRANYTPHSCIKIIMSSVGPGDQHGCPFKHNDIAALRLTLHSLSVSQQGIQEMSEYVIQGHYQLACAKYFELTHGTPPESGINHPNQFFEESQRLLASKTGNVKTE